MGESNRSGRALPESDCFSPKTLVKWKLSAVPRMDWATRFLMAYTMFDEGAARVVRGGGPGLALDIVWWFASTDEIDNADAEVKRQVAITNHKCGIDLSEQRFAQGTRTRNRMQFWLRNQNEINASDEVPRPAGRRTLPSFRWGY